MAPYTGVGHGPGGKSEWPIAGRVEFQSLDGYPLRPYDVRFRTKP